MALLIGCSDSDNDNVDAAIDQGDDRGESLAAQARTDLQDNTDDDASAKAANIVMTINAGEIAQASFVLSTSDDADVLDLAAQIQAEHQDNEAKLQVLLGDRELTPVDNQVALALESEAMAGLAELQTKSGDDLDFTYTRMQVMMHQEASVIIDSLRDYVDGSEMRDFLDDTLHAIEHHREHASDVLEDL